MKNILLDIALKEAPNKEKYSEVMEYLTDLFDEVLKNNNVEDISNEKFDEILENLHENLDYSKATEENLKNYFEALIKISRY